MTQTEKSAALDRLTPILGEPVHEERVSEWPNSNLLFGGTALRSKFRISAATGDDLYALAQNPWEWLEPRLPEDLTFLTQDGSVVAFSTTHEKFLAVDVSPVEASELISAVPGLQVLEGGL